jgi:hypothetical protein
MKTAYRWVNCINALIPGKDPQTIGDELLAAFGDSIIHTAYLQARLEEIDTGVPHILPSLVIFFDDKSICIMPREDPQSMAAFDIEDREDLGYLIQALAIEANIDVIGKLVKNLDTPNSETTT